MACLKLGSKKDGFQRNGESWFCATGLRTDIIIQVGETAFHLHKFPLLSRCGRLARLVDVASENGDDVCNICLSDIPGGAEAFELAAKFCYEFRMELTVKNIVALRCAAEYLEMTEEFGEGNLIARTDNFLNQVVLQNWKDSICALQSCESVLPQAEELGILKRCMDFIVMKAGADPNLFGWPIVEHGVTQSPGGIVLWNGISRGTTPRNSQSDWWYEGISVLSVSLFKTLMVAMEAGGIKPKSIAGALMHFAKRYLPVLNRHQGIQDGSYQSGSLSVAPVLSEGEQQMILEAIEKLLPMQKGITSAKFLFGLLRSATILNASPVCKSNLERRIGMQLEQASLEDMLLPNLSYNLETLYDIDCVQRILDHFLLFDQSAGAASPSGSIDEGQLTGSPSLNPLMMVARLVDGYLAEVAPDVNLKPLKFQSLAEALPDFSRSSDDGLYRAIDIYLKAHPWLTEQEREQLCRIMDCEKLSIEACTHAAQNERLPLRIIVEVLFFEQLQLRTAIASRVMFSENLDTSRPLRHQSVNDRALPASAFHGGRLATATSENQVLKVDMDNMRQRVSELERECTSMRQEIEKFGRVKESWRVISNVVSKTMGGKFRSKLCSTKKGNVQNQTLTDESQPGPPSRKSRKHKRPSLT